MSTQDAVCIVSLGWWLQLATSKTVINIKVLIAISFMTGFT